MKLHRRDLLSRGGAFAAGIASSGGTGAWAAKVRGWSRFGLADITVRKELMRDYAGTLKQVGAMGYTHFGFRLAAPGSEPKPLDKARMIRDAGMEPGVARLTPIGGNYDREIAQAVEAGARIVALTAAPPFISSRSIGYATRAAFDAWLPELAALAAKCRAAGLIFTFHNHWWDMLPLDGEAPLDIIARTVSPRDLSFEIDLGWTWYGGVAPLDLLARLGPRVSSMHLKDIDRSRGKTSNDLAVVVGAGEMGYAALLPRIPKLTSAVGYVEVDAPADGLKAAAEAIAFIRAHQ